MNISVPVTIFTRKCILYNFACEPVKISASETLSGALTCIKPGDPTRNATASKTLSTSVTFDVTSNVAKLIERKRLWRVGLHLDDFYREKLNEYIYAKKELGVDASRSIQDFCDVRQIEIDVDIAFETLYKDWQRFQKKKEQIKSAFFRRFATDFVRKPNQKKEPKPPLNDDDLFAIVNSYIERYPSYFLTVKGVERKKLKTQAIIYVFKVIGKRPPQYIAQKTSIGKIKNVSSKNTVDRKIRYAVTQFKNFLLTAPKLQQ